MRDWDEREEEQTKENIDRGTESEQHIETAGEAGAPERRNT